jgi:hypothetical protein
MAKRIDYESLKKKAVYSVIKDILRQIANEGLYKKQHIYITFSLRHPNVRISDTLRKSFDDEMTIILQCEFWDLNVDDYGFSVGLAFEHADEVIYIPYSSLISFSDPSEDFCIELTPDFQSVNIPQSKRSTSNIISIDAIRSDK